MFHFTANFLPFERIMERARKEWSGIVKATRALRVTVIRALAMQRICNSNLRSVDNSYYFEYGGSYCFSQYSIRLRTAVKRTLYVLYLPRGYPRQCTNDFIIRNYRYVLH